MLLLVWGTMIQRARCAPSPHSASKTRVNALMLGEGWRDEAQSRHNVGTPTPNPSPQGGGEQTRQEAPLCLNRTNMRDCCQSTTATFPTPKSHARPPLPAQASHADRPRSA